MIELKQPRSGACICLQTSMQKDFIANGRKYLTGELDLYSFRQQSAVFNDPSVPAKITFVWEQKDGYVSKIEIAKTPDFAKIFLSAEALNSFAAYNFEIGTTYYWRVTNPKEESEVFSFTTVDAAPRFLYVSGTTSNVRDIGGYVTAEGRRIKQGMLLRGAELDLRLQIDEVGRKTLHDTLGVRTDIDLRGEAIGYTLRSPIGEDVTLVQMVMRAYTEYISPVNFENLKTVFAVLADKNNYPAYFHCWGGADRTGCLAFTLEAILGLDEEKLMQDFELTSLSGWENIRNRDAEYFVDMVTELQKKGSTWRERMTNFLVECGVPAAHLEAFREIMLED
ncbi:MAG: tyrosine-protein phosphatase [Oscillospiraceae bacterium]|nr:tyrosine-protein phosphatase [Oscillospiraceae bacterium]